MKITQAIFKRDVSTFCTMNPRYTITWKDTVLEGMAAEGGGKQPKWDDRHVLEIMDWQSAGVITVTFLDGNDLIAQAELNAEKICKQGKNRDWYKVKFDGEKEGKVQIWTNYHMPDYSQQQQPMQGQQQMMQQQPMMGGGYDQSMMGMQQPQMGGYQQPQMGGYEQSMMGGM